MFRFLVVALVAATLSVSCSSDEPEPENQGQELLNGWAYDIFLPDYQALATSTGALATSALTLCDQPDEASLDSARADWREARAVWKRTEVLKFGPYVEFPDRLGSQIDFWPVRTDTVEGILAEGSPISADELPNRGAGARGFPVVEYLLWSPNPLDSIDQNSNYCPYLVAATTDLDRLATALYDRWDPETGDYLGQFLRSGQSADGAFDSSREAFSEVVNRMGFTVENIRIERLSVPAGLDGSGMPDGSMAESPFSDNSIADMES
ncbi:MAG: imelysin family protein, partial [Myxococcales bacterium]|nr:imelysin family protein [Myxococcales bacterium]